MSGPSKDLDDESLRRMARSFYVVRMVRYALLTVASLAIALVSAVEDAPAVVPIALVVVALVVAASMVSLRRRYVSSQRPPSTGPVSR